MEAAVATPDQWDVVAQRVGGGRSPVACMRQFLNLAVEETLAAELPQETDEESRGSFRMSPPPRRRAELPENTMNAGVPSDVDDVAQRPPPESSAAADGGGDGTASGSTVTCASSTGSGKQQQQHQEQQQPRRKNMSGSHPETLDVKAARKGGEALTRPGIRDSGVDDLPIHLGPASPALVLASSLISNVHPEVLKAAMAAASAAAEDLARRSAVGAASSSRDAVSTPGNNSSGQDLGTRSSPGPSHSNTRGYAYRHEGDGDVEMRNSVAPTSGAYAVPKQLEVNGRRSGDGANGENFSFPSPTRDSGQWRRGGGGGSTNDGSQTTTASSAARAAVLSAAGLQARGLAEAEDRRTEALVGDLLEAR